MKRYEIPVWLCGYGNTLEEAWEDALEGFLPDPGGPPCEEDCPVVEVDEDYNEKATAPSEEVT